MRKMGLALELGSKKHKSVIQIEILAWLNLCKHLPLASKTALCSLMSWDSGFLEVLGALTANREHRHQH